MIGRTLPFDPPRIVPLQPLSGPSAVPPPSRPTMNDPGDYFTGRIASPTFPGLGSPIGLPDGITFFRSPYTFNCLEIDWEVTPISQGWAVPEYVSLTLRDQAPATLIGNLFNQPLAVPGPTSQTGLRSTSAYLPSPQFTPWDFNNDIDTAYQAPILRATTALTPGITDISLTLPHRTIFSVLGTKYFRFAMIGWWMYHRQPHDQLDNAFSPIFTFRCWYDPARDSLLTAR